VVAGAHEGWKEKRVVRGEEGGREEVEAPPLMGVGNKSSANIVRARVGNPE